MRTTLDVDDDVLQAAKEIAANRGTTAGRVLSELARKGLGPVHAAKVRNGVPLMPRRRIGSPRPTLQTVNRLRDEPRCWTSMLVALFDPDHIHHEAAHGWLEANRGAGWATCPLTGNGLIRILSNAAYAGVHETAAAVRRRLEAFCGSGQHSFWPDQVSLRDERLFRLAVVSHSQVSDVYLLGLATKRDGRLATFDRRIPLQAVVGAESTRLEVIPAYGVSDELA